VLKTKNLRDIGFLTIRQIRTKALVETCIEHATILSRRLIGHDGTVKVLGFGLAKALSLILRLRRETPCQTSGLFVMMCANV
jgi:hypothetical protein